MGNQGIAVVTGGGKGIGAAICQRLAADGYRILLTYHNSSQAAEKVVERICNDGGDAFAVRVDCSDPAEVYVLADHPWIRTVTGGPVEVLVINHGRYDRMATDELTTEHLQRTMDTNFTGAFHVWKALAPHLTGNARIVVVGSQLGIRGSPHGGDYSASKAAFTHGQEALHKRLDPRVSASTSLPQVTSILRFWKMIALRGGHCEKAKSPYVVSAPPKTWPE